MIVVKGEGTMRVGEESAPVTAGQAVFVRSGEHHQVSNDCTGPLVYLAVYWHPELDGLRL